MSGKRAGHLFSKLGGACSHFLDLEASAGPLAAIWAADSEQDSEQDSEAPGAAQIEAQTKVEPHPAPPSPGIGPQAGTWVPPLGGERHPPYSSCDFCEVASFAGGHVVQRPGVGSRAGLGNGNFQPPSALTKDLRVRAGGCLALSMKHLGLGLCGGLGVPAGPGGTRGAGQAPVPGEAGHRPPSSHRGEGPGRSLEPGPGASIGLV